MRPVKMKQELNIDDTGSRDKKYIKTQITKVWIELRKVQKRSNEKRNSHVDRLVERYDPERQRTKSLKIQKIQ